MNNQTIYWLWIQQVLGYGSPKIKNIIPNYTFAEDFYRAPFEQKRIVSGVHPRRYELLENTDLDRCRKIMDRCEECGIEIITMGDPAYPESLRSISAPPVILFSRGYIEAFKVKESIAVVGTRSPSKEGVVFAVKLSNELASNGVCIVSGGALGIDTQAHIGALKANGRTICVLGCGHEVGYLKHNERLRQAISTRGVVVSEYPPDYPPSKRTFPQRNRIISGLSKGVVVIEAGKKSGSLITVGAALDQGKTVYAVPGSVEKATSVGTNQLIKEGATPVTCATDILDDLFGGIPVSRTQKNLFLYDFSEYIEMSRKHLLEVGGSELDNKKPKTIHSNRKLSSADKKSSKKKAPVEKTTAQKDSPSPDQKNQDEPKRTANEDPLDYLSEEAAAVLKVLRKDGELHIDAVAEKTGLPVNKVHSAATELEMEELIETLSGRRYKAL